MNGAGIDLVVLDDSEDEKPSTEDEDILIDTPTFEDEDEEYDSSKPYLRMRQQLDLPLGTAVLHLALPPLAHSIERSPVELSPSLLQNNLVVAVACADSSIRLLKLPLSPPSPMSKVKREPRTYLLAENGEYGAWGEQLLRLSGPISHQTLPDGVSMTFTPRLSLKERRKAAEDEHGEEENDGGEADPDIDLAHRWDVLVASHSVDGTGKLLIHRISVSLDGLEFETEQGAPDMLWRYESLRSPLVAARLRISSKVEERECPRVLIAEARGAVRIYDCCSLTRRNQGAWVISLYPGFQKGHDGSLQSRRTLDAQWVLDGRAIAVLMADGEWGIWNLSYPNTTVKRESRKTYHISAGIPTNFTISGWIGGSTLAGNLLGSATGRAEQTSRLAPMTPSTRKIRQKALFTGPTTDTTSPSVGGILVYPIVRTLAGSEDDESVILWHGDKIVMLPSMSAHWQHKIRGSGNLFGSDEEGQSRQISSIDVGGELRTAVAFLAGDGTSTPFRQPDVIVAGERSFYISVLPILEPQARCLTRPPTSDPSEEAELLARGELDLLGMDRMLESMSNGYQGGNSYINGTVSTREMGSPVS